MKNIQIGQKVKFDPFRDLTGTGTADLRGETVIGTVAMVNRPHRWFSVVYGGGLRTSFLMADVGDKVEILGGNT